MDDLRRKKTKFIYTASKQGGGKLLFWGGFLGNKRTKLVFIDGIMDGQKYVEVINEGLGDFIYHN